MQTADWDQPHRIRAYINFSIPRGEGPTVWGKQIFSDFGASLTYNGESGRVYTPYMGEGGYLREVNSARYPFTHIFSLRLYKNFRALGMRYSVYAQIQNLFNNRMVVGGFSRTGDPEDPGGAYANYSATEMDTIVRNHYMRPRTMSFGFRMYL